MAEIRTPKKQSFINRPVGVARTDAGEVQAAQQLANAARTLSNATFSTASQVMEAGAELQQNYEQEKFTQWAQEVPIVDESGQFSKYKRPEYISGRTKNEINNILQGRYKTQAQVKIKEYASSARRKYKNNPDEELLFAQDMMLYVEENAKAIEQSGGIQFAQSFRDYATVYTAENLNGIRAKRAERAEELNLSNIQTDLSSEFSSLQQKTSSGDPSAGDEYLRLKQKLEDSFNNSTMDRRLYDSLDRELALSFGLGKAYASGYSGLDATNRNKVLNALDFGTPQDIEDILPELAQLMVPTGALSNPQVRRKLSQALSKIDNSLTQNEQIEGSRNKSLALTGYGANKEYQKRTDAFLQEDGIEVRDPVAIALASQDDKRIADTVMSLGTLPSSVVNFLEGAKDNKNSDFGKISVVSNFAYKAMHRPDGTLIEGMGLSDEAVGFVKAMQGIASSSGDPEFALKTMQGLKGTLEERNTLFQKFQSSGKLESSYDFTEKTSYTLAKTVLLKKDLNPHFAERFAGVYAQMASMVDVSTADEYIDDIYNAYYKDYKWAFTAGGERKEQPYTLASYYRHGRGNSQLRQVEQEVENRIQKVNDSYMGKQKLIMGRNAFMRADERNTRDSGTWYLVDNQGVPIFNDATGKVVQFSTEGFKAQTALQSRLLIDAEEKARAIALGETSFARQESRRERESRRRSMGN